MDAATLAAYDRDAAAFARDWHDQPPPTDLHATVRRFFTPGPTADIGSGSGRDAAWLSANGYPAIGYDASAGLIAESRRRYPDLDVRLAALPDLPGIPAAHFANVLCETVIMHLPNAAVGPAVARMLTILRPGGTLYLSWRVTQGDDRRDEHGRLYAAFDPALVLDALAGTTILLDEAVGSVSSGKLIRRVVVRTAAG